MTILLLGSQLPDRAQIEGALRLAGSVITLDAMPESMAMLPQPRIDVLFLDLAAAEAIRVLRKLAGPWTGTPTVCIADRRSPDLSSEALRLGVADIVGRPVLAADVMAAVRNAREMRNTAPLQRVVADAAGATAGGEQHPLFATSPAMRDTLALVRRVAQSRCAVMVVGERGSGREMIARTIHQHGPNGDRPFTKVVCGDASSAELRQLFNGEVPEGSTVYLADLGELSGHLQNPLERCVSGSTAGDRVRFIAGVLPRYPLAVDRGERSDPLMSALSVVRIDMPPLRQRSQDVPSLAMHFLKQACRRSGQPAKTFSPAALALLAALPWPGNAGELRSLTERLSVLVPRGVVLLEDVLPNVGLDGGEAAMRTAGSLKEAREQFERRYVSAVLEYHRGRIGPAARELGIERTNLYRKIKQLKIRL